MNNLLLQVLHTVQAKKGTNILSTEARICWVLFGIAISTFWG